MCLKRVFFVDVFMFCFHFCQPCVKVGVKQDARYALGYFPPSIESGNRKSPSSLVKRILLRIQRQKFGYSVLGQMGTLVFEPLPPP